MAYNFPNSPSNGDTVTVNNVTYTYNSTSGAWKTTATSGSGGGGGASVTVSETAPSSPSEGDLWFDPSVLKTFVYYDDGTANQWVQSNPTGSGGGASGGASVTVSETAPTSPSAGDLWWSSSEAVMYIYYTDTDSSQWVSTSVPGADGADGADGAAQSYINLAAFPSTGNTLGDLAVAQDTKALYMWDGTEWNRIDNGNESPVIITEPPTTVQLLNSDGTTSTVTMTAQDPEGFDITYGIAYKTANNARPLQLASDTTINQSTGVYTFTPTTTEANSGIFRARLSASDGAKITTRFVDFNLTFFPQRSNVIGWYQANDTNSYPGTGMTWADISGNATTGPTLNFGGGQSQVGYTTDNFISLTSSGFIDLMPSNGSNPYLRDNAKSWMVVFKPPTGLNQFLMFQDGRSSNWFIAEFYSNTTGNFYGGYSAYSGETIVSRVNGTDVANNRQTAHGALVFNTWNSVIMSGLDFDFQPTYNGLYYNNYSNYSYAHEIAYLILWDVVLTVSEMEIAHNYISSQLGTSNMTSWTP